MYRATTIPMVYFARYNYTRLIRIIRDCKELYRAVHDCTRLLTIQDYTGQYRTMNDDAGCITIQNHCKIGCSIT